MEVHRQHKDDAEADAPDSPELNFTTAHHFASCRVWLHRRALAALRRGFDPRTVTRRRLGAARRWTRTLGRHEKRVPMRCSCLRDTPQANAGQRKQAVYVVITTGTIIGRRLVRSLTNLPAAFRTTRSSPSISVIPSSSAFTRAFSI